MADLVAARVRRLAAAGAVAIAVALASCGGSSVSRAEYAERVDAICADHLSSVADIVDPAVGQYFRAMDEAAFTDIGLQGYFAMIEALDGSLIGERRQAMFDDIAALPPPDDGAAEFTDHFDAVEAAFDQERADISAAAHDSALARVLWERTESPFLDLDHEAILLGIPSCRFG
jgi:hypothetical protein